MAYPKGLFCIRWERMRKPTINLSQDSLYWQSGCPWIQILSIITRLISVFRPFRKDSPPSANETLVTPCRYADLPCGIRVSNLHSDVKVSLVCIPIAYPALRLHFVVLYVFTSNGATRNRFSILFSHTIMQLRAMVAHSVGNLIFAFNFRLPQPCSLDVTAFLIVVRFLMWSVQNAAKILLAKQLYFVW